MDLKLYLVNFISSNLLPHAANI